MDPSSHSAPEAVPTREIVLIMREVCPLESDLVGSAALNAIATGRPFQSVPGGSHFDVASLVAILSSIATTVQAVWTIWTSTHTSEAPLPPDLEKRILSIVQEQAARHPDFLAHVNNDADVLNRLTHALKVLVEKKR